MSPVERGTRGGPCSCLCEKQVRMRKLSLTAQNYPATRAKAQRLQVPSETRLRGHPRPCLQNNRHGGGSPVVVAMITANSSKTSHSPKLSLDP